MRADTALLPQMKLNMMVGIMLNAGSYMTYLLNMWIKIKCRLLSEAVF